MHFPRPDGKLRDEIFARGVDARKRVIVEYAKARGMGDAGHYARYAVEPEKFKVVLLEDISKADWDGRDVFQWLGDFDARPVGKTWIQLYPTKK